MIKKFEINGSNRENKSLLIDFNNGDIIYSQLRRKSVAGLRVQDNTGKLKYRNCALLWEITYSQSKFNS